MDEIICLICQDPVRVPVKLICFPCKKSYDKRSCNDIVRVCVSCAREYLQLNKPKSERTFKVKCLTCDSCVDPHYMNADRSYSKDFMLMSLDKKKYRCFHSEKGCQFKGLQIELEKHNREECIYRITNCPSTYCKYIGVACNMNMHMERCRFSELCQHCNEYIDKEHINRHLFVIHALDKCVYCNKNIPIYETTEHSEKCEQRPISCPLCANHKNISKSIYVSHIKIHMDEECAKIEDLTFQIGLSSNNIQKALQLMKDYKE